VGEKINVSLGEQRDLLTFVLEISVFVCKKAKGVQHDFHQAETKCS
jgi:hypothetical protein